MEEENSNKVVNEEFNEPNEAQVTNPNQTENQTVKKPKKPINKKQIAIFTAIILVLVSVLAAALYFGLGLGKTDSNFDPNIKTTVKKEKVAKVPEDEQLERFIHPKTGETWLPNPKKVADLKYNNGFGDPNSVKYYEVGKRGPNSIFMSVAQCPGSCLELYEKDPSGNVKVIARPDANEAPDVEAEKSQYSKENFSKNVAVDKTIHYDSLSIPKSLNIDKGYKANRQKYQGIGYFSTYVDPENPPKDSLLNTYGQSELYRYETSYADTKLTSIGYYIKTPIQTKVYLSFTPFKLSTKGNKYSDRSNPKADALKPITRGCSFSEVSISRTDGLTAADLVKVGVNAQNQDIYELRDENNTLVNKAYKEFTDFTQDKSMPYYGISKKDFLHKEHALAIYKDNYGQYLVYVREQLAPTGGCAKPVVYLYPTKAQSVNVRVGAKVTVSDPYYNQKTGWQNVLAQPNGSLSYKGKSYDSLFWEGYGYGSYPSIKSGTVVKSAHAVKTIASQLAKLGLNKKESSDFLEYWQPKLPKTKYVVMSWITTEDMNNLAPLYISPKPDTLIRVFLDFWGTDVPVDLPQQVFITPERKGFTVVEWGGLLNGQLK
jgi:hypothetical protein